MRIYQVEIEPVGEHSIDSRLCGPAHQGRCSEHPDLRNDWIARMLDTDPGSVFPRRYGCKLRVATEHWMPNGKPGDGGDYTRLDCMPPEQLRQAVLDEGAVPGLDTVRIEAGESENSQAACWTWPSSLRRNASNMSRDQSGPL